MTKPCAPQICCTLEEIIGKPNLPQGAIPIIVGDTVRGVWYQGDLLQLAQGADGPPGSQIFTGTGVPSGALGVIGDLYIDNASPNAYYIKTGPSTWTFQANLQGNPGIPGPPGSTIRTGAGVPSSGLGIVNDFYVDTVAPNNFYLKTGVSTWTLQGSLQGIPGTVGPLNPLTYFFTLV